MPQTQLQRSFETNQESTQVQEGFLCFGDGNQLALGSKRKGSNENATTFGSTRPAMVITKFYFFMRKVYIHPARHSPAGQATSQVQFKFNFISSYVRSLTTLQENKQCLIYRDIVRYDQNASSIKIQF